MFCEEDTQSIQASLLQHKECRKNLRNMAMEMGDDDMLRKIAGGDFVAIALKYHTICLTRYRNRYRAFMRAKNPQEDQNNKIKGQAFAETVLEMESMMEDGTYTFKLQDLHSSFENRLRELGLNITFNRTRLKDKLLDYFSDFGLLEQLVGKTLVLAFPKGIAQLLEEAMAERNYEQEVFTLAKNIKNL